MQVIAIITSLVIATLIYFVGYLVGWYYSDRRSEDEIIKLRKEVSRWKSQVKMVINEMDKLKAKETECKWLVELLNKYQDRYWPYKRTIEETYKEQIITSYKKWKLIREIAEEIWCWKSTIQRAIKKRWLKR